MRKKALTLIELILGLILISGTLAVVSGGLVFFVNQLKVNLERSTIHTQMDYTMQDMKIRCVSALGLGSYFPLAGGEKQELSFEGECDMYKVTLNDLTDNCMYKYSVDPTYGLVLNCTNGPGGGKCNFNNEVLIETKFKPAVKFIYDNTIAPDFLKVELQASSSKKPIGGDETITKKGGIRFWFIDVVS